MSKEKLIHRENISFGIDQLSDSISEINRVLATTKCLDHTLADTVRCLSKERARLQEYLFLNN